MPSKERIQALYRDLLTAAIDQPQPSKELRAAVNALLDANTASLRYHEAPPIYGGEHELAKPLELDQ